MPFPSSSVVRQLILLFLLHKLLVFGLIKWLLGADWSAIWQFDNLWYQRIVEAGYQPLPQQSPTFASWAFAPLYPSLANMLTRFTDLSAPTSLLLVSQILHALSVWLMYRLAVHIQPKLAWYAAVGVIFSPIAWIFSLGYSESLFLCLLLLYWLSWKHDRLRWLWLTLLPLARYVGLIWYLAELNKRLSTQRLLALGISLSVLLGFLVWGQNQHGQTIWLPLSLQQYWHRSFLPFPALFGLTLWHWWNAQTLNWRLIIQQLFEMIWLSAVIRGLWQRVVHLPTALYRTSLIYTLLMLSWPINPMVKPLAGVWPLIGAVRYLSVLPATWLIWGKWGEQHLSPLWFVWLNSAAFIISLVLYWLQLYVP